LNSKCEASEKASVRILLVDDFEQFRTLVSSILTKQPGYQVVGEAADGLEGVLLAKELKPDLVVLDMQLPKLNGIEVARQIRRCSPDSTILFLTGNSDPELVREALLASATGIRPQVRYLYWSGGGRENGYFGQAICQPHA